MNSPIPCDRCGYHAPAEPCPHCGFGGPARHSAFPGPPRAGRWTGVVLGLSAVPRGLWLLAKTPRTKRWLIPPFVLTLVVLVLGLRWTFGWLDGWLESGVPSEVAIESFRWPWLEDHGWGWVLGAWHAALVGTDWLAERVLGMATSKPLTWVLYFLIGSLVAWYCFSIAYEAFAGPFLDEVHARFESRWFGEDPRSRLQRPTDIPGARCARLTTLAGVIGAALAGTVWALPGVHGALALPAFIAPFAALSLYERPYGQWLRWVLSVEGGALLASFKASAVTTVVLVLALPLYFIPTLGYGLFALVTGFATSVSLLDIPYERRGWSLRMRIRFTWHHLPALVAFGTMSGALLAIPIIGPVLMVPSASVGGLWLLCKLDKRGIRQ